MLTPAAFISAPEYRIVAAKSSKLILAFVVAVYKSSDTLAASPMGIWNIDMILVIISATPPFPPGSIFRIEASLATGGIIFSIASALLPAIAK